MLILQKVWNVINGGPILRCLFYFFLKRDSSADILNFKPLRLNILNSKYYIIINFYLIYCTNDVSFDPFLVILVTYSRKILLSSNQIMIQACCSLGLRVDASPERTHFIQSGAKAKMRTERLFMLSNQINNQYIFFSFVNCAMCEKVSPTINKYVSAGCIASVL